MAARTLEREQMFLAALMYLGPPSRHPEPHLGVKTATEIRMYQSCLSYSMKLDKFWFQYVYRGVPAEYPLNVEDCPLTRWTREFREWCNEHHGD